MFLTALVCAILFQSRTMMNISYALNKFCYINVFIIVIYSRSIIPSPSMSHLSFFICGAIDLNIPFCKILNFHSNFIPFFSYSFSFSYRSPPPLFFYTYVPFINKPQKRIILLNEMEQL